MVDLDVSSLLKEELEKLEAAKEAYILEFFGNRENVERYAKDYVFETYPTGFEYSIDDQMNTNVMRMITKFQLRRKLPDEYQSQD